MASQQDAPANAATQVFAIAELKEMILLQLDPRDILDYLHEDGSLYKAVKGSLALRQKLYLVQTPMIKLNVPAGKAWEHQLYVAEPNRHLFPKNDADADVLIRQTGPFRTSKKSRIQYSLHLHESILADSNSEQNMPDNKYFTLTVTRIETNGDKRSLPPMLPPAYLHMHLSDREAPVQVLIDSARIWVPAGKTIGDVLHWADVFAAGVLKESDVLNGIFQYSESEAIGEPTAGQAELELLWRDCGLWVLRRDGIWLAPVGK